jgi:FixJ family two-component response regulator
MTDGCTNFSKFLIEGTKPNLKKIKAYVDESLMLVTALSPVIGSDVAVTMGGAEGNFAKAYARICDLKPDVPVIFATGYSPEIELLQEAQRKGLSILQKPYVPRELARRVREALDHSSINARRV